MNYVNGHEDSFTALSNTGHSYFSYDIYTSLVFQIKEGNGGSYGRTVKAKINNTYSDRGVALTVLPAKENSK